MSCFTSWHRSNRSADESSALLIRAVKRGDLDEMQTLLELGTDPNSRSAEVDEVGYPDVRHSRSEKHMRRIGIC